MTIERTRWALLLAILTPLVALAFPTANALAAGPPTVQITAPANGSSTNDPTPVFSGETNYYFNEELLEELGSTEYVALKLYEGSSPKGTAREMDAQPALGGTWSAEFAKALPDGIYTAQATQTNSSEEPGASEPVSFTIDTVPPQVTLTSPVTGSSTSNGAEHLGGGRAPPLETPRPSRLSSSPARRAAPRPPSRCSPCRSRTGAGQRRWAG